MMTKSTEPQVVRNYLAQLEAALDGVPNDLRRDILDGIAEELGGLDAPTAAARIEELGDPAFIAAEARDGVVDPASGGRVTVPHVSPVTEQPWFVVLAGLLVAFGFFLIPIVGWVAGIVLMWLSGAWLRWEKWLATLIVPVGAGLIFGVGGLYYAVFPGPVDVLTLSMIFLIAVPLASGIWVLVRGLRRAQRSAAATA